MIGLWPEGDSTPAHVAVLYPKPVWHVMYHSQHAHSTNLCAQNVNFLQFENCIFQTFISKKHDRAGAPTALLNRVIRALLIALLDLGLVFKVLNIQSWVAFPKFSTNYYCFYDRLRYWPDWLNDGKILKLYTSKPIRSIVTKHLVIANHADKMATGKNQRPGTIRCKFQPSRNGTWHCLLPQTL